MVYSPKPMTAKQLERLSDRVDIKIIRLKKDIRLLRIAVSALEEEVFPIPNITDEE